jgi:hypothetical protein
MSICTTCNRDPDRMNGPVSECSHVECPHRRHAWSERPGRELFKGPHPTPPKDADPVPLDKFYRQRGYGALRWAVITAISTLGVVVIVATRNTPV